MSPAVGRHLRPLSLETVDALPAPCRTCTFWEVASAPRGAGGAVGGAAKEAWLQSTTLEWGPPGRVLFVEDRAVAWALLVPGRHAERVRRLAHAPSDDALLLATMWVEPEARGSGLARVVLQTLLRDTHERGGRAVEAYGARGAAVAGRCVLPEAFLLSNGFTVLHDDARFPLLRLDLRRTVRWTESVAGALEQVLGTLPRRRVAPVPARPSPAVGAARD